MYSYSIYSQIGYTFVPRRINRLLDIQLTRQYNTCIRCKSHTPTQRAYKMINESMKSTVSTKTHAAIWIGVVFFLMFIGLSIYQSYQLTRHSGVIVGTITVAPTPIASDEAAKASVNVVEPAVAPAVVKAKVAKVKVAAGTCSKVEKDAYAKAFANAERANQLLGRIEFKVGPGPCR